MYNNHITYSLYIEIAWGLHIMNDLVFNGEYEGKY